MTNTPKIGQTVNFGAHGARPGRDVLVLPAMVCAVHAQADGLPLLDLYIWNSWTGQNGYAWKVKGFDKLRVGAWSSSEEIDEKAIELADKPEVRTPGERMGKVDPAPEPPTPTALDPQTDGMPNVFGGLTRYNPAVDRQQHSDDKGRLLWVCPACDKWHWIAKGDPLPQDGSCCADAMKRRAAGKQANARDWLKWKKPDDTVLVGAPEKAEPEADNSDGAE